MTTHADLWTPGQLLLGDFQIERKLGEGGMGAVYLVQSRSTDERFAVKKTHVRDPRSQANFLAELQTWIDLPENPHLAACRFFRTIDDEIVIFADFVEGGSLADWIRDRRLTRLDQILDVAIQTAWGLHAAHELGLVHQDVKPGNFLLTADGIAKVSDFGLSRARAVAGELPPGETQKMPFDGQTQLMQPVAGRPQPKGNSSLVSCGGMTPAYRSPEQAAGHKLSRRTDIWSWGLSVLEMFNGEVTWIDGQAAPDILAAYLLTGPAEPRLPPMPSGVSQVLERCFRSDPEERWATLAEAADTLRQVYFEAIGQAYPRPVPTAAVRTSPQHIKADEDPHWFLAEALRALGRDPREADALVPPRANSRRAQAVADIATLGQASHIFEKLVAAGRIDLIPKLASLYHCKAKSHQLAKDLPGALEMRQRAVDLLEHADRNSDLTVMLAEAQVNVGYALWQQKDFRRSLVAYDRAIELYENVVSQAQSDGEAEKLSHDLAQSLALVYLNKAASMSGLGDHRGSLAFNDQAKTILLHLVKEDDSPELADKLAAAHMGEAEDLELLGRFRHAGYAYDEAIAIRERLVNEQGRSEFAEGLSRAYVNKAIMFGSTHEPREAAKLFDKAIAMRERLINEEGRREMLDGLARVLGYQATTMAELEDFDAARALLDRSMSIWEQLVLREGQSELAHGLGMACMDKGSFLSQIKDYAGAIKEFDRSIAILERLVDQEGRSEFAPNLAGAIMNKSHALKMLGDNASALALFDHVIPTWQRLVEEGRRELAPELAKAYENKARVAESAEDLPVALGLCDQAADLYLRLITREGWGELKRNLANCWVTRAAIRDKMGQHAEAVVELDEAIKILDEEAKRLDSPRVRKDLEIANSLRATIYWLYQLNREDASKPGGAVDQLLEGLAANHEQPPPAQ